MWCKSGEINALEAVEILTNVNTIEMIEQIEYKPKVVMYIYIPFNQVRKVMKNGNVMAIRFGKMTFSRLNKQDEFI